MFCSTSDVTLTITLSATPDDLILTPDCVDVGLFWEVLTLPQWAMRYEYAPPSQFLPGQMPLSAVQDAGAVAAVVVAKGDSLAAVEAQKATLAAVLAQWRYNLTVTAVPDTGPPQIIAGPWRAMPTVPVFGQPVTHEEVSLLIAAATVSIPVNPPGAP
jgi:hypothetical protein